MKIIFLGLSFPDMNKSHNLYTDLVSEFDRHGHEVLVVAPAVDSVHNGLRKEKGVNVLRVPTMKLFKVGKYQKGLSNVLLPYQYKRSLKNCGLELQFDLIVMPTPPITLTTVAAWLKRKSEGRVYLVLRDIFPQNAVDLKMIKKNGVVYRYFRKKEQEVYHLADKIGCMSQGNIDYVLRHNKQVPQDKMEMLPNWGQMYPLQTEEESMKIKEELGLAGKFVLLFGGNVGLPQRMGNIVALAEACSEMEDVKFLIVGSGNEKENLLRMISESGVTNMVVKDAMTREKYFGVLQACDVGLISLSQDFTIPNIPSKSLMYFNAKKPILASIDVNTDYGKILERLNVGLWAKAGDTKNLKEKLVEIYSNPKLRKTMGNNGYSYMRDFLQTKMAYESLMKQVSSARLP